MQRIRKAIFPVAGLGTRFLPATKAIPKEMLTVVDRPVIQHVVDEARAAGIEHFIFVTGRNKGAIEDHFGIATPIFPSSLVICPSPAPQVLPDSKSPSAWDTRYGAHATLLAMNLSRFCCPICCIKAQSPAFNQWSRRMRRSAEI